LVEQKTFNLLVVGSIPTRPTIFPKFLSGPFCSKSLQRQISETSQAEITTARFPKTGHGESAGPVTHQADR
jgi:hypothetical protein